MSDQGTSGGKGGDRGGNPPRSSQIEPAVVAVRMEELTAWVVARAAKMPREQRFTLGDKLVETCLGVTCLLIDATYTRDKLALLARASRGLTRARVLARLADRARLLSHEQLAHFERETIAVGRMLGGWTRSTQAR